MARQQATWAENLEHNKQKLVYTDNKVSVCDSLLFDVLQASSGIVPQSSGDTDNQVVPIRAWPEDANMYRLLVSLLPFLCRSKGDQIGCDWSVARCQLGPCCERPHYYAYSSCLFWRHTHEADHQENSQAGFRCCSPRCEAARFPRELLA